MQEPHVPDWFRQSLELIDPTYVVVGTEDHNGYFISKDVELSFKANDGRSLHIVGKDPSYLRARGRLEVLWVQELGEHALDELRRMKAKALELGIYKNPVDELAYYQKLKREAKQKKMDFAVDIITEGLVEMDRLERKKSWSYGGS